MAEQPLASLFGGHKPPVSRSPDLARILALPRRPRVEPGTATAEALIEHATAVYSRGPRACKCPQIQAAAKIIPKPCITRLNYAQAWSLHELTLVSGLVGNLAVGVGKTLLDLLAPLAVPGCRCAVLFAPSNLTRQIAVEYDLIAEHFRVPTMSIHAGVKSPPMRTVPGAPVLYVIPYSRFQRAESTVFLESMQPDLVIVDEAQHFANLTSTRSSRFLRYFAEHPGTRLAAWSGTLTDDNIQDYCLDPDTRVLTSDLRWVPVSEVRAGDELVGFDESLRKTRMRRSTVEATKRVTKRRLRLTTNHGTIVCSDDHQWVLYGRARTYHKKGYTQLGGRRGRGRGHCWIQAKDIRAGDLLVKYCEPWEVDETREGGYLAGLLDGEGWVSGSMVGFAQKPGVVLDRYRSGLRERGFEIVERGSGVRQVFAVGDKVNLRLLGMLRPSRLLAKASRLWEGRAPQGYKSTPVRVLAVDDLGPGEVCAVQTSTRTLLAEGLLSHNCHFCGLALGEGSPLPLKPDVVDEWGTALNPDDWVAPPGALMQMCEPGEHVQDGYHRRLTQTLGFVATSGASIDADLEVLQRPAPALPDTQLADPRAPGIPELGIPRGRWPGVATALRHLRSSWCRPDGEELVDALAVARCARELACGLFLRWKFTHGETEAQILEWLAARKDWRSELRGKLQRREPHLDSPLLCANAAARAWGQAGGVVDFDDEGEAVLFQAGEGLPMWRAKTWPRWRAIRDAVRPETEAIRLDPFLANDAAAWALQERGIVWYATVAFGTWVAEISGLPQHAGGPKAEERISAERGDRSIVCSIKSHGTGRDGLQRLFSTQLVAQPPASAVAFEQLLGRLSRIGQAADKVSAHIYRHTPEVAAAVDAAMRKSMYVQRTMGSPQKLVAGWKI